MRPDGGKQSPARTGRPGRAPLLMLKLVAPRDRLGPSVERLTREAFEKLTRLREAEQEAAAAFYAVLDENRHDVSSRCAP